MPRCGSSAKHRSRTARTFPARAGPNRIPRSGSTRSAPRSIERSTRPVSRPNAVRALGITGQLDGCVPTDAAANALAPAIIWMDRRADHEIEHVSAAARRAIARGLVLDATHMAAKIRWFERHGRSGRPRGHGTSRRRSSCEKLTGRAGLRSRSRLHDDALRRARVAPASRPARRLRDRCGDELPGSTMPGPSRAACRPGAVLTGLAAGTPVAVGTGDDFSNPLGAGVTLPGCLACSLGTAEVVGAFPITAVIDTESLVETHGCSTVARTSSNPGWLCRRRGRRGSARSFAVASAAEMSPLAASVPMGSDGVTLPARAFRRDGTAMDRECARGVLWSGGRPRQGGHRARGARRAAPSRCAT